MLGRECRLRLRVSGPRSVNSHISPKEGEIWGTLVRGKETSLLPIELERSPGFIAEDIDHANQDTPPAHVFVGVRTRSQRKRTLLTRAPGCPALMEHIIPEVPIHCPVVDVV